MQFSHVGELESSKSAMYVLAPELSALITILRSTGPVISTRRSMRSWGIAATFQSPARISAVSARKSGNWPESISLWRMARSLRSWSRRAVKRRASPATKRMASGVRISDSTESAGRVMAMPSSIIETLTGVRVDAIRASE
jgi:hypothetical protein